MISVFGLAACQPKVAKVAAIDLTDLDTTVAPGTDFYRYVNGGWMAKNPLKPEFARYGTFDVLRENNEIRLNELFKSMTTMKTKKASVEQKIVDLYKQGLDSTRRNAEGNAPLKKYVDEIYASATKDALIAELGKLNKYGEGGFFGVGVESDLMDSNSQILWMSQGGLGMGDRDYYIDPSNAKLKEGYKNMLVKLFTLTDVAEPEKAAANALAVEDVLAKASWSKVENRDYTKLYNPMSSEQIFAAYPGFDFKSFMESCGIDAQEKVIVCQPSYFEAFSKFFAESELKALQDYLAAQLIQSACNALSDEYYSASFDFFSRQMSGVQEQNPRWKRAMSVPNGILGEAVGQMYVKKYFPAEYKKKVLTLVQNLRTAFAQHIEKLEWMSDSTKVYAQEKLNAFTVKIGYPDKWKDYSSMIIDPEQSYYENLRAASAWYVADNLSKLGKPTDKSEWGMTPQTVNAYYNPTTNEICFPAAILQPPFFNPDADDAVNYGAIGVVIGHEMTHGFDDQGRLFDKDGNMNSWWTAADEEAFKAKAEILAKQFDAVEILPGLYANGHFSLGENIADHGGVSIAYTALLNSFGNKHPKPIDGFTAEQRFFMGYGHVWASNCTDEEKARLTRLDVHSLSENRVNVTLRNFQIFFDAFGITENDPMWRPLEQRVSIW